LKQAEQEKKRIENKSLFNLSDLNRHRLGINVALLIFFATIVTPGGNIVAAQEVKVQPDTVVTETRSNIINTIRALEQFSITSVAYTTDSMPKPAKIRRPVPPKPFASGRFEIVFEHGNEKKVLICQTEEFVGHYATVIPGDTDIKGYVLLYDKPQENGVRLTPEETKLLAQILYRMFARAHDQIEDTMLNNVKDYVLAILFSGKGKEQVSAFHAAETDKLP
jgi:hypothetical protein